MFLNSNTQEIGLTNISQIVSDKIISLWSKIKIQNETFPIESLDISFSSGLFDLQKFKNCNLV